MRWADWIIRRGSPSHRSTRRKTRLSIHPLEERTVPHGTGADHLMDHPTEPTPTDVAVVKEETPPKPTDEAPVKSETPPTPTEEAPVKSETPPAPDDKIIHLDDVVIEPGDGVVTTLEDNSVSPDEPVEAEIIMLEDDTVPPEEAVVDDTVTPHHDSELMHTTSVVETPSPKPPYPQIGDRIWLDQNANGFQDPGEPGLGFVTLQLYKGNTLVGTTTSDGTGAFAFNHWNVHNGTSDPSDNGLKANTAYQIRVPTGQSPLNGLRPTFANVGTGIPNEERDSDATAGAAAATLDLTVGTDEIYYHYDIGYVAASSVGNLVWTDANNNGKKDKNEPGIAGVTVRLLDTGGTQVATTTTAADGSYKFTGLMPGTYVIEVAASNFAAGGTLVGATSSTGKVGQLGGPVEGAGTPDPDANSTDGDDNGTLVSTAVQCKPVTLTGGSDNPTVDFGFFHSGSLNGRVYVDVNGNGRIDPEDTSGVSKVKIRVAGPAGTFNATTDANGNYQLAALPAGTYTVMQMQPKGYRSSTTNLVTTALTSGPAATVNFGEARVADLRVGVSAGRVSLDVGGTVLITYRVKNLGTLDATGVVLAAPLPAGYKYVTSDAVGGASYDVVTQRATIGTVAAGEEVKVQVRVQAMRPGTARFKATVQGLQFEDNLRNNTSGVVVTAHGLSILPTTKWMFARG